MLISESGRIVVVDDKREEVATILDALGKEGIPYIYFDGTLENLPKEPLKGIRFVFLDIELQGMKAQQDKTKASGVVAVLKKVISVENGPYAIGFWTAHQEVIPLILENCEQQRISPVVWVDVEKLEGVQGVIDRIEDKLKTISAFQVYVEWENTVNNASKEFVLGFSTLVNRGSNWSKDTAALFYSLYKAFVEKKELSREEDKFKCACHLMNRSFLDTLENITRRDLTIPAGFKLENTGISNDVQSKLNTSLYLTSNVAGRHYPGNVYIHNDSTQKELLIQDLFINGQAPSECELCMVIITPECDLAQNKVIKIKGPGSTVHPMHRVLLGLKIPYDQNDKLRGKRDSEYHIGPVWFGGKSNIVILHFGTISFQLENKIIGDPIFSLQRDLLFDIMSKAANHINRFGIYLLK